MILLDVPPKEVLLSQRVNKTWQLTIQNSAQLQRKLFFAPEKGGSLKFFYSSDKNRNWSECWKYSEDDIKSHQVHFNPLILKICEALRRSSRLNICVLSQLDEAWHFPTASWRRMLVSQPSVETKFAIFHGNTGNGPGCSCCNWKPYSAKTVDTATFRLGATMD